jgi:hypothetical protein
MNSGHEAGFRYMASMATAEHVTSIGGQEMSLDSLTTLETKIQEATGLNAQHKTELLNLLADLKDEIADLSTTSVEHAHSITSFTDISAHEATKQVKNQQLLHIAIEGLSTSVKELEASHPELVATVNKLCNLLSSLGI